MYILCNSIQKIFLPEQATGVMYANDREGKEGGNSYLHSYGSENVPPNKISKNVNFTEDTI
jgi:hypothetical protein